MKNTILPSVVAIAALALVSVVAATDADANLCGGTGTACTPTSLFVFNSVPNSQSFSDGSSQAQITKGSFIDTFDFELSPPPVTYNTVTDTVSSGFGSDAGMTLALFFCGTVAACDTGGTQEATTTGSGVGNNLSITAGNLLDGFYYVLVSGTNPNNIQSYGGTIAVSGTPIPGTIALFAGGLGLLGFSGLRKRKNYGRVLGPSLTA